MNSEYDVELSIEGSLWVTVTAEDEDEAHDTAKSEWRGLASVGDVDVDDVRVETVQKVSR